MLKQKMLWKSILYFVKTSQIAMSLLYDGFSDMTNHQTDRFSEMTFLFSGKTVGFSEMTFLFTDSAI